MDTFEKELYSLQGYLLAVARKLVSNSDAAEDLLQQTNVRAIAGRYLFDPDRPGTSLQAWLFVIMRNLHVCNVRGNKFRNMPSIDEDEYRSLIPGVMGNQEHTVDLKRILEAIERLPEYMREAIKLVCIEEYSYQEVADQLGVKCNTVKSRVHRGRAKLNRLVECLHI